MKKYKPLDLSSLNTYSLHDRHSKVSVKQFARPSEKGTSLRSFIHSLPDQLAGRDLLELVLRLAGCVKSGRPIVIGLGAHVIKVGLNPILIDLMEKSIISGLAVNGACIVHDTEIAMVGRTSEDVDEVLGSGAFGAARETGEFINKAISSGAQKDKGIGQAVGEALNGSSFTYNKLSLLATAERLGIPVTVHVAVGTDIVHIHPDADGAAIGKGSLSDFRLFCAMIADLQGGAYLNFGSAVLLPEVFLKALTAVRNIGHRVNEFTTANFDFIRHYRTMTNVVNRPTSSGGKGFNFIGHHEIMIPLLAAALLDELDR
jgi:hypothetical protein